MNQSPSDSLNTMMQRGYHRFTPNPMYPRHTTVVNQDPWPGDHALLQATTEQLKRQEEELSRLKKLVQALKLEIMVLKARR